MNFGRPVHIIATGGTIDKVYSLAGELEIGSPAVHWLLAQGRAEIEGEVIPMIGKDSLEITDHDRGEIAEAVDQLHGTGIVITHGTDTMVETGRFLSEREVASAGTTVVLTGAIEPAAMRNSDAAFNLGSALVAAQVLPPGVFVAMNGRILPSDEVAKDAGSGVFGRWRANDAIKPARAGGEEGA